MAPELLVPTGQPSSSSDVFSLGIVFAQMFSLEPRPLSLIPWLQEISQKYPSLKWATKVLACMCEVRPERRPSAADVANCFRQRKNVLPLPPTGEVVAEMTRKLVN